MRLPSLTDQIYIKARRIRSIEEKHEHKVAEGIGPEFIGIVNYGVIALIQCKLKPGADLPAEEAKELYNDMFEAATSLMCDKNHDYDEAWRQMRVSSFTDIILTKLHRIKQIEDHDGKTLVSEGVEAGYMEITIKRWAREKSRQVAGSFNYLAFQVSSRRDLYLLGCGKGH